MEKASKLEKIFIIILFIIFIIAIFIVPNISNNKNTSKLIINEVMTSNKSTISDSYYKYSDYIELYNGYDYDIDLSNYYLSDNLSNTRKWIIKEGIIKAHDYLTIYATGKDTVNNGELHTNFKLNSDGEHVILSNDKGKVISKVYVDNTLSDTSFGYNGEKYVYYYNGSPNKKNEGNYQTVPITSINDKTVNLKITEYMIDNLNTLKSYDGKYYSLIEIHNEENYDINLKGYYLTDKSNDIGKYQFPDITIKANTYLIVYTSGLNTYKNNELHTNFSLDNSDGIIILSNDNKALIDKVNIKSLESNLSYGLYQNEWYKYNLPSFGKSNTNNYLKSELIKDVIINEVSASNTEAIELKNVTNQNISLKEYSIGDKSGAIYNLPNITIKANSYITLYGSDKASYKNNKVYLGFHINNSTEIIYLYKNNVLIDTFEVDRLTNNISTGINNKGEKVYYKNQTFGKENHSTYYLGYTQSPLYSINGGYVEKGTKINLSTTDGSTIYYTLDGSFPTNNSTKYTKEITIDKTTVIKAIAYKNNYLASEIVSRTFIVGRTHDVAIVSLSTNHNNLFGGNGLLTNYMQDSERKISFEFYESDGKLGVSFIGGTKLTGADSRKQPQKSMAVYLRKEYGLQEVAYPFFKESDTLTYSSFTLRNSGEDPKRVRIQDTALTYALKDKMDIDIQDYRPVVVYINGSYYGLYNLREKLNGDYVESNYNIDKNNFDLIKYGTATNGTNTEFRKLVNYVKTHDCSKKEVYEYLKTQIDMQELCNYFVAQTFYANSDAGNIRYWKSDEGKWRFMLYDLDWSFYFSSVRMSYPFIAGSNSPVVTYDGNVLAITKRLYKNSEFKELYLTTLAYHLKNTFTPSRMHSIIDELSKEIENEMVYHIKRWGNEYPTLNSMNKWKNNLKSFKNSITKRYNTVLSRLKSDFNLSNNEYKKYFGDL